MTYSPSSRLTVSAFNVSGTFMAEFQLMLAMYMKSKSIL